MHEQEQRKLQRQNKQANNIDNESSSKGEQGRALKANETDKEGQRQYTILDECHDFFCQVC